MDGVGGGGIMTDVVHKYTGTVVAFYDVAEERISSPASTKVQTAHNCRGGQSPCALKGSMSLRKKSAPIFCAFASLLTYEVYQ